MGKLVTIPSHIIASGEGSQWYNILNGEGNRIGTLSALESNQFDVINIWADQLPAREDINTHSYFRTSKTGAFSFGEMAGYNHLAKPATYFAERWTELSLNIAEDGEDYKVTLPVQLRRGEKLPNYNNNASSWGSVKLVVELWNNAFLELIESVESPGINVTKMFQSEVVNVGIPVPNLDETYKVVVKAYYTVTADTLIEDTSMNITLTAVALQPYALEVQTPILAFGSPSSTFTFYCKNTASNTGNAQAYTAAFRVICKGWFGVDPETADSIYGLSEIIGIYPQDTEEVTATFSSPSIPSGLNTAVEYSVTIFYDSTGFQNWVQLYQRIWNEGLTP